LIVGPNLALPEREFRLKIKLWFRLRKKKPRFSKTAPTLVVVPAKCSTGELVAPDDEALTSAPQCDEQPRTREN
jgi:hypothetical protein